MRNLDLGVCRRMLKVSSVEPTRSSGDVPLLVLLPFLASPPPTDFLPSKYFMYLIEITVASRESALEAHQ